MSPGTLCDRLRGDADRARGGLLVGLQAGPVLTAVTEVASAAAEPASVTADYLFSVPATVLDKFWRCNRYAAHRPCPAASPAFSC